MKQLLLLFGIFLFVACNTSKTADIKEGEFVFRNVNVVPMTEEILLEKQDVFIKDGKITHIGNTGEKEIENTALVIDGTGKYLMPGMAEMHAHVPAVEDTQAMKDVLLLFAVNGITTIRGMLGHPLHLALREGVEKGRFIGPHLYTAGPGLTGSTVKTPEAADSIVKREKKDGYDFLKLLPGLTRANFDAIAKTAKEVNIPFAGHVSADVGVWRAIEAGYATIDHLDGFVEALVPDITSIPENKRGLFAMHIAQKADTSKIDTLMKALAKGNIWVVPTQALAERWFTPAESPEAFSQKPEMVYMNEKTLSNWINSKKQMMSDPAYDSAAVMALIALRQKLILTCQQHNVGLLSGSDAPQVFDVPGFSLHQELKYMVDAGLTPYQALQSSTVNVAKFLNKPGAGAVKTGAVSDLVLLAGNPLKDITQTGNIEGVLLGTQWLSKQKITDTLQTLKGKIIQ
ncbi:MAG: amidohydrolase family protein [Agriterribacter sp.]